MFSRHGEKVENKGDGEGRGFAWRNDEVFGVVRRLSTESDQRM